MADSSLVIRRIRARPVLAPMKLPLHTASGAIDQAALVLLDLDTTAGITGPVFTFGGIKGQVASAEAAREQALLAYQLTILNAFRETNDALTGTQKKTLELAEQQKRVDALRELAKLSRLRFDRGITGYVDVLVAENELFAAELAAVRLSADRYAQSINVYRAMGGGWVDLSAEVAAQGPLASTAAPTAGEQAAPSE